MNTTPKVTATPLAPLEAVAAIHGDVSRTIQATELLIGELRTRLNESPEDLRDIVTDVQTRAHREGLQELGKLLTLMMSRLEDASFRAANCSAELTSRRLSDAAQSFLDQFKSGQPAPASLDPFVCHSEPTAIDAFAIESGATPPLLTITGWGLEIFKTTPVDVLLIDAEGETRLIRRETSFATPNASQATAAVRREDFDGVQTGRVVYKFGEEVLASFSIYRSKVASRARHCDIATSPDLHEIRANDSRCLTRCNERIGTVVADGKWCMCKMKWTVKTSHRSDGVFRGPYKFSCKKGCEWNKNNGHVPNVRSSDEGRKVVVTHVLGSRPSTWELCSTETYFK